MSKRYKRTIKSFHENERQIDMKAMKKSNSSERNWNDMTYDVLVTIFMALSVEDSALVSLVSPYWRQACSDPAVGFWNKLDLSRLSSNSMAIPKELHAWSDEHSSKKMTQFLKNALSLSNGNTSCLIYPFFFFIKDEHLITAAERSRNLKRLVLPHSGQLSEMGIDSAMRLWGGLESMTIFLNNHHFLAAIGKYCKNFTELKMECDFDIEFADALVKYTPNLKVLSLRSNVVTMKALSRILNCLEHLKVVNLCECLILKQMPHEADDITIYWIQDLEKYLNASCMQKLIIGDMYDYNALPHLERLELYWREDQISSLAH